MTVCLGGGAAWLAGRAIAQTWRPMWHVVAYMALLGAAVRFIHFALFGAELLTALSYAADTLFLILDRLSRVARDAHDPDGDPVLLAQRARGPVRLARAPRLSAVQMMRFPGDFLGKPAKIES